MGILADYIRANGVDFRPCGCSHCLDDSGRRAEKIKTEMYHCIYCGSFFRLRLMEEIGFCKLCNEYDGIVKTSVLI